MFKVLLVSIALFSSCQVADETDDDPVDCKAACANLERLQCPGWQGGPGEDELFGNEDDLTCVEVCEIVTGEPTGTLYPDCTAKAKSCSEVEDCFN